MTRFVHTSDWQLGMTRHFLAPEAQARFTAARIEAVGRIGALALAEGCGFVVVAGDVFESNQVERQVVVRALEAMAATPGVTFYLLAGNHDPLNASSVFLSPTFASHRPANVVVIEGGEPIPVSADLELVGAPWRTKRPLSDLVGAACAAAPTEGRRRVVVGHGAVDAVFPAGHDPATIELAAVTAAIDAERVAYVALGDRHSTLSVGPSGRVRYSGAPEPTDFTEDDPGNVLLVEIDRGGGVHVEPRAVATWRFLRIDAHVTSAADVQLLHEELSAVPSKERTIVRLGLVGQLSLRDHDGLVRMLDHHGDLFGALDRWAPDDDLIVVPEAADVDDLGLAGFAAQAFDELRDRAGSDPVATDALALLYRLAGATS